MPIAWEAPKGKKIDEYIASILTTYLIDIKSKIPYSMRSLKNPVQEVTKQDVGENILPCWWLFMKDKLAEYKRYEEERKKKLKPGEVPTAFWLWHPPFYLWETGGYGEYKNFVTKLTGEEIGKAREELKDYIGFRAYAYLKSEIREDIT